MLQPSAENGGATVSSYELYIDDGNSGAFVKVASYDSTMAFVIDQAVETTLVSGKIYKIKMRALNQIGYSDYSDIVEIAMANVPAKPSAPTKIYDLSSETSVTV